MAILRSYADNTSRECATLAEVQAAIANPPIPALYSFDTDGQYIQIIFGSPTRTQYEVTVINAYGVEKQTYDDVAQARAAFYALVQSTLNH